MGIILGDWRIEVTLIFSIVVFYIYHKISALYRYFEERKIPHIKGTFPVGSDIQVALLRKSIALSVDCFYWKIRNEKIFGFFVGTTPYVVICDPLYISKILVSDFEYFHDRNFIIDEKSNPLEAHLFFLNGNKWKSLRNSLTPIFTTGKLKYMFPQMKECSNLFINYLDQIVDGKDMDLRDLFARYATDVIASTAFGIEPESIINPENTFRKMGKKFFIPSIWVYFLIFIRFAFPKFLLKLKLKTVPEDIGDFFSSLFLNVLDQRRSSGIVRKDFVQLLLELRDKGYVEIDSKEIGTNEKTISHEMEKIEITDMLLAAQSFVFLLAGFETTSDAINYILYALSKNKNAQDKARREILQVKQKYGEFTYDALKEMTYLDNCISETMRLYPPVPNLTRMCTKDYTFPNGTTVEKGTNIYIPIYSIQRDPEYYSDPHLFDPDRFNESNSKATWLPFGDGPRHCIGKRFAVIELKIVLASMLEKYYIEESKLTKEPIKFAPTLPLTPVHPLWVKLSKIHC